MNPDENVSCLPVRREEKKVICQIIWFRVGGGTFLLPGGRSSTDQAGTELINEWI